MCGWLRTHRSYQTSCRLLIIYKYIFLAVFKSDLRSRILRVILQWSSRDCKGSSIQYQGELSGTGPGVDAKTFPPIFSPVSSQESTGPPNCFIALAIMIAIWQLTGCWTGDGRGRRWWAPLPKSRPEKTEGWIYGGQWSWTWKGK